MCAVTVWRYEKSNKARHDELALLSKCIATPLDALASVATVLSSISVFPPVSCFKLLY